MKICITGSWGLIGSAAARFFLERGDFVVGIDNNMRSRFFGRRASTAAEKKLLGAFPRYAHRQIDIRDSGKINHLFRTHKFDAIIHCAAQPSHDKASQITRLDFEINAGGTLTLLEATRRYCSQAVFIFTSTNKVYGDQPNRLPLKELSKRFIFRNPKFQGIDETLSIDQNLHSPFGVSKTAADLYVQEYGRNFGLKTTCLRLGCVTGVHHHSVELHGFLSYLIKSLVHTNRYRIIGYKGKQVRDQIDAKDVARAMHEIIKKPGRGAVFNLGGGAANSASILELIKRISQKLGTTPTITYTAKHRTGDHICYITDFTQFTKTYPRWKITRSLEQIIDEIITYETRKR